MTRILLDHCGSPNGSIETAGQRMVSDSHLEGMEHDNLTEEQRRARVTIVEERLIHRAKPGVGESEFFAHHFSVPNVRGSAHLEGIRLEKLSQISHWHQIWK